MRYPHSKIWNQYAFKSLLRYLNHLKLSNLVPGSLLSWWEWKKFAERQLKDKGWPALFSVLSLLNEKPIPEQPKLSEFLWFLTKHVLIAWGCTLVSGFLQTILKVIQGWFSSFSFKTQIISRCALFEDMTLVQYPTVLLYYTFTFYMV